MNGHSAAQDKHRKKTLAKGMTVANAKKKFPYRPNMGDCRAFTYSPSTGKAVWT